MLRTATPPTEILHDRLLAALDQLIKERYGNFKRAEETTGVRSITLRQWRRGSRRPSLLRILQTIEQLRFTLLDVVREASLYPELYREPSLQLAAVLPRQEPHDSVLTEVLARPSWRKPGRRVWCEIPDAFTRLEVLLGKDPRIARVEFLEYLTQVEGEEGRVAALCLWAMMLNSSGANIDAGLAIRAALERISPACPLHFLLLSVSASVAKNLRSYSLGRAHAERSILGFLRAGDTDNAARGLLTLGIILWAVQDFEESERAYRDALRLSPNSRFASMCRFNLIYNYLSTGRNDLALQAVESERDNLATIPAAYLLKARWLSAKVLMGSNRREAAIVELKTALRSDRVFDENPQVIFQMFFDLANLLAEAGRCDELPSYQRHLMPLLAHGDDSVDSVAISRAFLKTIRSGTVTGDVVRDFARRYENACDRLSKA